MIETAVILDPTVVLSDRSATTRDDVPASFSFAGALSALEARAAQSLETFGATPRPTSSSTNTPPEAGEEASARAASGEQRKASTAAGPDGPNNPQQSLKTARAAQSLPQNSAAAAQPATLPVVANVATIAPTGAAQSGAPLQRTEAPVAAKVQLAKMDAPKAPRAAAQPTTPAMTQDFATLVARRLDAGGSAFELRLDPPALGRVDVQLKLSDVGEATLSLKFENQLALDHFARDEAGLRTALGDAGYDLDREHLVFSLAENDQWQGSSTDPTDITEHYEPQFFASYSRGVVDLRA